MTHNSTRESHTPNLVDDIKSLTRRVSKLERISREGAQVVVKPADGTIITGTALQEDPDLFVTLISDTLWYEFRAYIKYRADATQNGKIGFQVTIEGTGTVEIDYQMLYTKPGVTAGNDYVASDGTITRTTTVDGDGNVSGSGFTNQRVALAQGYVLVGIDVTEAVINLVTAEDGGTGTGIKVVKGSFMRVRPLAPV